MTGFDAISSLSACADELALRCAESARAAQDLRVGMDRDAQRAKEASALVEPTDILVRRRVLAAATISRPAEIASAQALATAIERHAARAGDCRALFEAPLATPSSLREPELRTRPRVEEALVAAATEYFRDQCDRRRASAHSDGSFEFQHPRPTRWGGDLMSHAMAARMLQYRSGPAGRIASGNTLRKAIQAAPEGDPLAELRDTSVRRAKDAKSGKLRRKAVEWVARERGVDVDDVYREADIGPAAPGSPRNRGKPRSARARDGD